MSKEFDGKHSDDYYIRRRNWAIGELYLSLVELVQVIIVEVKARNGK